MHKIRRKPPPIIDPAVELNVALDVRYPSPDPSDPFAPLWVLRSRNSTNDLKKLCNPPRRAQSPVSPVPFPIIHDHVSTVSDSSNTTDTSLSKWHNRVLRRVCVSPSHIPTSSSTSTSSSFVHVSVPSCDNDPAPAEWTLPTRAQLARAASLPVVAASGLRVSFASLFAARPTIVVFIRHFWCPHCQDYVSSIAQTAPRPSEKNHFNLVVIGNGPPMFIPKYRALFGLEFEMYTDPTLAVYSALGMGRSSANGDYAMGGLAKVVLRMLKAGLPVWQRGGDIHQLGGEFIFGPGLTCTYAHRMQSPKDHAPIRAVLSTAGIEVPPSTTLATPPKLLSSLRIKSWTPQRRSRSLNVLSPNMTEPSKSRPNRQKNMSTGTHPLLGPLTKTRAESPSPSPSPCPRTCPHPRSRSRPSSSPITEFGAWCGAGRVSAEPSRVLSEGEGARHSHTLPFPFQFPYTTSPCQPPQPQRPHASTATLPMPMRCASPSPFPCAAERGGADADADAGADADRGHEDEAWSPCELVPAEDGDEWMRMRVASLEAIKARKRERRAGVVGGGWCVPRLDSPSPSTSPERGKRLGSPGPSPAPGHGHGHGGRQRQAGSSAMACEPLDEAEEMEE